MVVADTASLTPLFSWLKGAPSRINPSSFQQKKTWVGAWTLVFFRLAKSFCVLGAFWPHEFEFFYAVHLFTLDSRTCFICDVIRAPILFYRHWSTLNGFQCALLLLFGSWRRFQPIHVYYWKIDVSWPSSFYTHTGLVPAKNHSKEGFFSNQAAFPSLECNPGNLTLTFQFVGNLNQNRRICWHLQTPFKLFTPLGHGV